MIVLGEHVAAAPNEHNLATNNIEPDVKARIATCDDV